MKKWLKITLFILLGVLVLLGGIVGYGYYKYWGKFKVDEEKFPHNVEYINPKAALFSEGFETCSPRIAQYYNPERATYSKGKNGLRKFVLSNYKNQGYKDSGYLNFRFVINCKGKVGRYVIHQNNLNLEPTELNPLMVEQLFEITRKLDKWNPNIIRGETRDSYMYISYRIENGEIVEILP